MKAVVSFIVIWSTLRGQWVGPVECTSTSSAEYIHDMEASHIYTLKTHFYESLGPKGQLEVVSLQ